LDAELRAGGEKQAKSATHAEGIFLALAAMKHS
jgi:hypothetical protein